MDCVADLVEAERAGSGRRVVLLGASTAGMVDMAATSRARACPPRRGRPGRALVLLEDAGHLPVEQPGLDQLAAALGRFLEGLGPQTAP